MKIRHILLAFVATIVPPGFGWQADELDDLFYAIGTVESGHDDNAVGDGGASIGRYQIQKPYWIDATEFDKTIGGRYEDVRDPAYARKVMRAYWRRYEPEAYRAGNYEVLAKAHNGGWNWRKYPAVKKYWIKVKTEIERCGD